MSDNLKNDVAEEIRGIGSKRTGGEENLQMRKNWKFGTNPTSGEAMTRIRVPHYCICLYCIIQGDFLTGPPLKITSPKKN